MKDNNLLISLITSLMKTNKPIWRKVAYELSKPRRQKVEVNVSKVEQYATEDATILVPGKVLGSGTVSKKITVAAFSFSTKAKGMINEAGGKAISIESLHKSNPEGKGVMILK